FSNKLGYLKKTIVIALFVWISFFPPPIQDQYWIYVRIFFGVFLLILILNKKYLRFLFSFQDWPLWLFLICLLSGIVSATDKSVALRTYLYLVTTFLPLFYIGKYLYGSDKNINMVSMVICICAGLVALIGLMELYFGKNILYENFIFNPYYEKYVRFNPRPMGTQFHPVVLGSYLLGCLPFSFSLFRKKSLCLKLLGILISLLCAIVIMLTPCRGVHLGFVALLLFYLWKRQKKRFFILFLFCLILLIMIFSYQKDSNLYRFEFGRIILGSDEGIISEYGLRKINLTLKVLICRSNMTLKILKDYPFFGIGLNHFRIRFNAYYDKATEAPEIYDFQIPDNMYFTFLAETGIVGTLAFLIFIFSLLKRGLRQFSEFKDENKKYSLLILMSALIGFLINMGAYDLFYWNNPYALFCLVCGFIQGLLKKSSVVKA
ncbi:MAG: O-antigen ligase family protein, partial [Candidatus Omnitrophota bacterium]|nr:O-antigen ligase family protein [Candidatus Omnitrophota bacterium]